MKINRLSVMALVLAMAGVSAVAQDQGTGGRRQRGQGQNQDGGGQQRGGGGREEYMARLKERLAASDDEWKVIQPKLEKVMTSQRGDRGGRGGRDGNRGGGDGDREQSAVGKAQSDLRAALDEKSTSAEEINKKLTALREAREKSRADRAALQKELKEVLSARQEAVLVSSGLLE